jgi:hypothetical protein
MKNLPSNSHNSLSFTIVPTQSQALVRAKTQLQPLEAKIIGESQDFVAQAQRINQIAKELEGAILELKSMASNINSQRRYILPGGKKCSDICEYNNFSLPWVGKKQDGSFVLATQKIDLFRAEKEAELLAQKLRQQTKKLTSQQPRKNQYDKSRDS